MFLAPPNKLCFGKKIQEYGCTYIKVVDASGNTASSTPLMYMDSRHSLPDPYPLAHTPNQGSIGH